MARFFKTTATPIDPNSFYAPPLEFMNDTLKSIQTQRDKDYTELESLSDTLPNAEVLLADEPAYLDWRTKRQSEIDAVVEEANKELSINPSKIKALQRGIKDDMTVGNVGIMQKNAKKRKEYEENIIKRVEKGDVLSEEAQYVLEKADLEYTTKGGAKYVNPTQYNKWSQETLSNTVDLNKLGEDAAIGFEADVIDKGIMYKGNDGYLYHDSNRTERVSREEIINGVKASIMNNERAMDYVNQRIRLGYTTPEKVQKQINDIAEIMANKRAYTKKKTDRDMDTNQYTLKDYGKKFEKIIPPDVSIAMESGNFINLFRDDIAKEYAKLTSKNPIENDILGAYRMKDINDEIATIKAAPALYPKHYAIILDLEKQYDKRAVATFQPYYDTVGKKATDDYFKQIEEQISFDTEIYLDNPDTGKVDGTPIRLNDLIDIDKDSENVPSSVQDLVGIRDINIIRKIIPAAVTKGDLKDIRNDIGQFEIEYRDSEGNIRRKTAYIKLGQFAIEQE
ncbi:MAG: hypothetical protein ACRC0V_06695 [Fusobacteriaceae bacterium]